MIDRMIDRILIHTQNFTQVLKVILHEIPEHDNVFQAFFLASCLIMKIQH